MIDSTNPERIIEDASIYLALASEFVSHIPHDIIKQAEEELNSVPSTQQLSAFSGFLNQIAENLEE